MQLPEHTAYQPPAISGQRNLLFLNQKPFFPQHGFDSRIANAERVTVRDRGKKRKARNNPILKDTTKEQQTKNIRPNDSKSWYIAAYLKTEPSKQYSIVQHGTTWHNMAQQSISQIQTPYRPRKERNASLGSREFPVE
jgi:hypothetical protein